MGIMNPPEKCHITDQETKNFPSSYDLAEYLVEYDNKRILFRFHWNHKNSKFVNSNKHILQGLILNNKFPKEFGQVESAILNNEKLEEIIRESIIPITPDAKMENLLSYLHSLQDYEGAIIEFPQISSDHLAKKLYFKNYKELTFYLFTLLHKGYIEGRNRSTKEGPDLGNIYLTYEGLSKVIDILESGTKSDKCFVAMSFSDSLRETREAIKISISNAGYHPILIDEIHYDADVTINDALIAEIKKCKFLVADFTQHKHGVYFEAGFALGLKRPVIYLCQEDEFAKTHFDTNHYPHIIYSSLDSLQESLENKIQAWIN